MYIGDEKFKIVFLGSSDFSIPPLLKLLQAPWAQVVAVVTQPDKPKGRGQKVSSTPVKELALSQGIKLLQPASAKAAEFIEEIKKLQPDICVVAAYGLILPPQFLRIPKYGTLNVHASMLPKYRGPAPIQRALLAGETVTGVSIILVDEGVDSGPVLAQKPVVITIEDNLVSLSKKLSEIGADLLVETIPSFITGRIKPIPQDHSQATYAPKVRPEEGWINWSQPAVAIWNKIRALTPEPGVIARLPLSDRSRVKIWEAKLFTYDQPHNIEILDAQPGTVVQIGPTGLLVACANNTYLWIISLQREGAKVLDWRSFSAGLRIKVGFKFLNWEG